MKIEILIIAAIAVVVTVIVLIILNKKNKQNEASVYQVAPEEMSYQSGENTVIDYNVYIMKKQEFIFYAVTFGIVFFGISYIFYKSILVSLLFSLLGLWYPKLHKQKLIAKRKQELSRQFQQALFSLSSSLVAGRSVENAFLEVTKDLELLYPDPNTYIIQEFNIINQRVANRETIESAIKGFSDRAGIDDIANFTDVFITCKRTGGDLVEVIRRTANMISEKIDIQQEISVMVAQKKFESNALSVAPIAMVAVIGYAAGDYMAPLYSWAHAGPIVMTVALGILAATYWWSQKIMDIKV